MAVGSRALSSLLTIVLCWGIAACAPAEAKPADKPPEVPVELLASVAIGPASTLRGLQKYLEAIRPGIGSALTDQMIRGQLAGALGVTSLDGLDPAGWLYLLVTDAGGTPTLTALGKVSDAKRLTAGAGADHLSTKNGWALVGQKPQLDRLAAYAFGVIAGQPTPRLPTATVFMPQVLTHYQPQLAAFKTQMMTAIASAPSASASMTQLMTSYIEAVASIGDDTLQLIVTFDAAADVAGLDFALVPRDKSRLAEFTAAQRPTDFALLDKLPAIAPTMLAGGHLELGPYHDGFIHLMTALFDPSGTQPLVDAFEAARKAMSGDAALAMQIIPGVGTQLIQLSGTSDAKLAAQAIDHILDLFKAGRSMTMEGVVTTIKTTPQTTTYGGVTLHGYDTTYDLSKASELQREMHKKLIPQSVQHSQVAVYDAVAMVAVSQDSVTDAKKVIDASRGKPGVARFTPSPIIRDQLAAARARKDSMAILVDVSGLLAPFLGHGGTSPPLALTFGAADHNAHFRLTMPAETLHALAGGP
jgi:hypothetical protein